jgi:hypothetical protein
VSDWRPIPGYEGIYEIRPGRDGGAVRRIAGGKGAVADRVLKLQLSDKHDRYLVVTLYKNGRKRRHKMHHLLLTTFKGRRLVGQIGRHLDDNKQNHALDNLAWGTKRDNTADAIRNGAMPRGLSNGRAKLAPHQVAYIRRSKLGPRALGRKYGVSHSTIRNAKDGTNWAHIARDAS